MSQKLVAIHQPNFFPWLGFFHKIYKADCFVFLDHVRLNPDQSWFKRVKILNQGDPYWLSIPVSFISSSSNLFPKINEVKINQSLNFKEKHLRTFDYNYRKTPYFSPIFGYIEDYYYSGESSMALRNSHFIEEVCKLLQIKTPFVWSSSLSPQGEGTDMLIDIIKRLEGTAYLCGGGAQGYQEDHKFLDAGIELIYQEFSPLPYFQGSSKEFVPGLSIIDPLMREGAEQVFAMLQGYMLAKRE